MVKKLIIACLIVSSAKSFSSEQPLPEQPEKPKYARLKVIFHKPQAVEAQEVIPPKLENDDKGPFPFMNLPSDLVKPTLQYVATHSQGLQHMARTCRTLNYVINDKDNYKQLIGFDENERSIAKNAKALATSFITGGSYAKKLRDDLLEVTMQAEGQAADEKKELIKCLVFHSLSRVALDERSNLTKHVIQSLNNSPSRFCEPLNYNSAMVLMKERNIQKPGFQTDCFVLFDAQGSRKYNVYLKDQYGYSCSINLFTAQVKQNIIFLFCNKNHHFFRIKNLSEVGLIIKTDLLQQATQVQPEADEESCVIPVNKDGKEQFLLLNGSSFKPTTDMVIEKVDQL